MRRKSVAIAALALLAAIGAAQALLTPLPAVLREGVPDLAGQMRPASFVLYAAADIGDGTVCLVGADEVRGRSERFAAVLRVDAKSGVIVWNRSILVPGEHNGSRATHCAPAGDSLYILVQRDWTSSSLPLLTGVTAARLDTRTGGRLVGGHANLPDAQARLDFGPRESNVSVWVEPGAEQVRLGEHVLTLKARSFVAALEDGSAIVRLTPTRDVEIKLDRENLLPVE